jgi:tRNA-modifying protein YgfZ
MGTPGYQALREGAAWLDLSSHGKIVVRGEDRARLIHALCTNHVQALEPGQDCYAFFLNAQGRILCDAHLLCMADGLLLDTEPETARKLYEHIDKYIIADDVTLEDATATLCAIGVEGPRAAEVGASFSEPDCLVTPWSATGAPGARIFAPSGRRPEIVQKLQAAGAVAASAEDVQVVRLEHGRPRYGEDITESHLSQETQLTEALHFNKGCYLGQEIVERVRSRGHVNRLLVKILLDAQEAPPTGTPITAGELRLGEVTSAAFSPALGKVAGLGYVRADHARKGVPIEAGAARGEIAASRPE